MLSTLLRRDHSLENVNLKVRRFTYSKTDLLLTGLTDDISDETLSLFIEAKLTPDFRLTTNEERTKALIQSNKPIGKNGLGIQIKEIAGYSKTCIKRPLKNRQNKSFVCFVALRPKSTAMVIAGRSVHLPTLFPGQA